MYTTYHGLFYMPNILPCESIIKTLKTQALCLNHPMHSIHTEFRTTFYLGTSVPTIYNYQQVRSGLTTHTVYIYNGWLNPPVFTARLSYVYLIKAVLLTFSAGMWNGKYLYSTLGNLYILILLLSLHYLHRKRLNHHHDYVLVYWRRHASLPPDLVPVIQHQLNSFDIPPCHRLWPCNIIYVSSSAVADLSFVRLSCYASLLIIWQTSISSSCL